MQRFCPRSEETKPEALNSEASKGVLLALWAYKGVKAERAQNQVELGKVSFS